MGDTDEKVLENAEMGGRNDVIMWDLVEVVSDDLPGINEEQDK